MKIVILNGSPKGNEESVTMIYIKYLKKKIPQHEFVLLNVAQKIKRIEKDEEAFQDIINQVESADGIIWGFPLFVMLVPAQYKRFIELIFERKVESAFEKKYALVLSTSIHFYDHTAHNYMQGICDDLNMKYVANFPADSWDFLYTKRRMRWLTLVKEFLNYINNNYPTSKHNSPLILRDFEYNPEKITENKVPTNNKKILIVHDSLGESTNLGKMINRFKDSFSGEVETINLHNINIKGGCISCLKCGYDHKCTYIGKDDFIDFWESNVIPSEVLIFAGTIKDRYLSALWKMVLDRTFYMNHTPTLIGKQIGFIISGPLSQIPNLTEIFQGYVEGVDSNFVDMITDEFGTSADLDALLHDFARKLILFSESDYIKPPTFLGEGGKKIFRDDIYGRNRFVFLADHEYYEKHGLYNTFPQRDERAKKMNERLIPLLKIDKVRMKINFRQEFLRPFNKVLNDEKNK